MDCSAYGEATELRDDVLVERFVREHSDEAFRAIAGRYSRLVYGVCKRRLRRNDLAEDACQSVFVIFARKAPRLVGKPSISNWLYTCALQVSKTVLRDEEVRARYEMQASATRIDAEGLVESLEPALDDAIAKLRAADREAIVLRYLQGYTLKEVGTRLDIGEDAARMRVNRALERLRSRLCDAGLGAAVPDLAAAIEAAGRTPPTVPTLVQLPLPSLKMLPRSFRFMIPLTLSAPVAAIVLLAIGAGTGKIATAHPSGFKPPLKAKLYGNPPLKPRHQAKSAQRRVAMKEGMAAIIAEFPGRWTWSQTTDQPGASPDTCSTTVTLNPKTGALAVRGGLQPDGSYTNIADWTADANTGTMLMGSESDQPFLMRFVSGTVEKGIYALLFSRTSSRTETGLTLTFSPSKFSFVIKVVPKAGSAFPGPMTVTSLFTRP